MVKRPFASDVRWCAPRGHTHVTTTPAPGRASLSAPVTVPVLISVETRAAHQRTSDANGRFTIVSPDGGGRYELTARFIGMAAVQVNVARQADEDRIVAHIRDRKSTR